MDAMLEPSRRMITNLLEADARFFREYHYLNPLMVDPADQFARVKRMCAVFSLYHVCLPSLVFLSMGVYLI
jgi:hypothetical protein